MTEKYNENDLCKTNAHKIGARIRKIVKEKGLSRNELADILHCCPETISRKNRNADNKYYNYDDICILSKTLKLRKDYLLCLDDFKTETDLINSAANSKELKVNYQIATDYLKSIGIKIVPGYYWCGTIKGLYNLFDDMKPLIYPECFRHYQKKFSNLSESDIKYLNDNDYIYVKLNYSPESDEILKIDDLTKQNDIYKSDSEFILNDKIWIYSFIELRFEITIKKTKTSKLISVEELNNLFSFMDNSNTALINNFLLYTTVSSKNIFII